MAQQWRLRPLTAALGGALTAAGYALAFLSTAGYVPLSTALMCVYFFVAWQGAAWTDTAALSTTMANFPRNRGRTSDQFFKRSGPQRQALGEK